MSKITLFVLVGLIAWLPGVASAQDYTALQLSAALPAYDLMYAVPLTASPGAAPALLESPERHLSDAQGPRLFPELRQSAAALQNAGNLSWQFSDKFELDTQHMLLQPSRDLATDLGDEHKVQLEMVLFVGDPSGRRER